MNDAPLLKPAVPFGPVDHENGWEPVPGGAPGVEQKMLSGELDEDAKLGVRTRLIRFQPGTVAASEFLHDYWEEVYLIEVNPRFFGGLPQCLAANVDYPYLLYQIAAGQPITEQPEIDYAKRTETPIVGLLATIEEIANDDQTMP